MGYGRIKKAKRSSSGEWIQKIMNSFSHLYCCFNTNTENYRNGICVTRTPEGEPIDVELAEFLCNAYLEKNKVSTSSDEEYSATHTEDYFNIVLEDCDEMDENYETINQTSLNNMDTILNHPIFYGSKSINDLKQCIQAIEPIEV